MHQPTSSACWPWLPQSLYAICLEPGCTSIMVLRVCSPCLEACGQCRGKIAISRCRVLCNVEANENTASDCTSLHPLGGLPSTTQNWQHYASAGPSQLGRTACYRRVKLLDDGDLDVRLPCCSGGSSGHYLGRFRVPKLVSTSLVCLHVASTYLEGDVVSRSSVRSEVEQLQQSPLVDLSSTYEAPRAFKRGTAGDIRAYFKSFAVAPACLRNVDR